MVEDLNERQSTHNDTTLGTTQLLSKNRMSNQTNESEIQDKKGCAKCLYKFDRLFWHKKERKIARNDHIKAAPCVSVHCLAGLRITIALILVSQSITTILLTSEKRKGF